MTIHYRSYVTTCGSFHESLWLNYRLRARVWITVGVGIRFGTSFLSALALGLGENEGRIIGRRAVNPLNIGLMLLFSYRDIVKRIRMWKHIHLVNRLRQTTVKSQQQFCIWFLHTHTDRCLVSDKTTFVLNVWQRDGS